MLSIGPILKAAREDKDLRQIDVMKEIGINNKNLSGYENCVAEPDLETLGRLCNFYGLSLDEILGLTPEKPRYSDEERKVIRFFRHLDIHEQEFILKELEGLVLLQRRK